MAGENVPLLSRGADSDGKSGVSICCCPCLGGRSRSKTKVAPIELNMTVVGKENSGKTSLIYRFTRGCLPEQNTRTIIDTDGVDIMRRGKKIHLVIHDTSGTEEDARLRALTYANCDLIIMCFPVDSPEALHNIVADWAPEVRTLCCNTPYLLVGTKKDLRRKNNSKKCVSKKEGEAIARQIGSVGYFEYSAHDEKNAVKSAKKLFGTAIGKCLEMRRQ
ncbi:unnamed protein product [Lymnaea stagnalis]|uniref:Uncharacterized protein n=1 Tax=Lymnaea stagnalis TaxID=6523 RepID=A0AAV2IRA4_LYMST